MNEAPTRVGGPTADPGRSEGPADLEPGAARPPPPGPALSEPSAAPSPLGSSEGRMILLFDVLWALAAVPIWGLPAAAAAGVMLGGAQIGAAAAGATLGPVLGSGLALPVAYFVFLAALIAVLSALRIVLPPELPGTSRVFADRAFFRFLLRWGLESYLPPPLLTHVQLLTSLRVAYYRGMGAQIAWSTHISPGARVWSLGQMRFGHLTYLGEHAHLTGHLSRGDKLLVAPIVLGDRCNVGAHVHIAPGCSFGSDVKIGALTDIAPGAFVEDDVDIGPRSVLGMGVRIGKGARIEPRTFVDSFTTVPEGEVWAGDPGKRVGVVEATDGERRKRARDRRRGE